MEFLIVLVVIACAIACAYWAYAAQQKRTAEMAALATELGWPFRPEKDHEHDEDFSQFEVFRHGHSRYAYNTLIGKIQVDGAIWPVKVGDFHYQTTSHNGKHTTTHTHRFSYIVLRLPYGPMPELLVRREGMFDAVKDLFGFDDIDFESAEFSRRFCVKSPDRRFAYDVIHPLMIEFLMGYEPPTIDIEAGSCLLTDGQSLWSPAEFRATLDWVQHFFHLWPQHVTRQLEHQAK